MSAPGGSAGVEPESPDGRRAPDRLGVWRTAVVVALALAFVVAGAALRSDGRHDRRAATTEQLLVRRIGEVPGVRVLSARHWVGDPPTVTVGDVCWYYAEVVVATAMPAPTLQQKLGEIVDERLPDRLVVMSVVPAGPDEAAERLVVTATRPGRPTVLGPRCGW